MLSLDALAKRLLSFLLHHSVSSLDGIFQLFLRCRGGTQNSKPNRGRIIFEAIFILFFLGSLDRINECTLRILNLHNCGSLRIEYDIIIILYFNKDDIFS